MRPWFRGSSLLPLGLFVCCCGTFVFIHKLWAEKSMVTGNTGDRAPPQRPCDERIAVKLESIYDEMRERQLKAIKSAGALRPDPFFVPDGRLGPGTVPSDALAGDGGGKGVDDRRCLAVSAVMNESVRCRWTPKFRELERRLREEFGDYGITFSQQPGDVGGGQLHWTLMQLVGFPDYGAEVLAGGDGGSSGGDTASPSPYLTAEYLDCIQDSLTVGGLDAALHITYTGVVVVATGLLMVGIPSLDVNAARDTVRSRLADQGLPLREPFVNDIVHSTLFRVAGDPADMPDDLHLRLISLAEEYEKTNLGRVVLERFQVGPASWRVLPSEMEATPPLRTWTVPLLTPREQYDDNVLTEEEGDGRGCYTVSGASGAKLARELRQVLSRQTSEVEERKEEAGVELPTPLRPSTTPSKGDYDGKGADDGAIDRQAGATPPQPGLDGLKNFREEIFEHINSEDLRDSIPRGDVRAQAASPEAGGGSEDENGVPRSWDNSATISGVGGLALAQELQKKLEEERRALDRMYYTDFY